MKKAAFLFFALSLFIPGLHAQQNKSAQNDSIVFEKLVHDYGSITQGSDGNCEFTFTNKGKVPLILSNVKSSCGCTIPEWPRQPIEPGKTGTIKVKYNTNRVGTFGKSVTVSSSAINSSVVLRIKGNVTPKQQ